MATKRTCLSSDGSAGRRKTKAAQPPPVRWNLPTQPHLPPRGQPPVSEGHQAVGWPPGGPRCGAAAIRPVRGLHGGGLGQRRGVVKLTTPRAAATLAAFDRLPLGRPKEAREPLRSRFSPWASRSAPRSVPRCSGSDATIRPVAGRSGSLSPRTRSSRVARRPWRPPILPPGGS